MLRRFRSQITGLLAVSAAITVAPACNGAGSPPEQRVFVSNEEFDRGRADGLRDAQWSLFDDNGSWMWLWMAGQNYSNGYRQGWREGRAQIRFQQDQDRAREQTGHPEHIESAGEDL